MTGFPARTRSVLPRFPASRRAPYAAVFLFLAGWFAPAARAQPIVALSADTLNFGEIAIGDSLDLSLALANTGDEDLEVSGVDLSQAEGFVLVSGFEAGIVAAGTSREIVVRCKPAAPAAEGSVSITSNAAGSPHQAVLLCGGVEPPEPLAELSADRLDFGTLALGDSLDLAVTVASVGEAALQITKVEVVGAVGLLVVSGGAAELEPGASADIVVRCRPNGPVAEGTLTISTNDSAGTHDVALVCRGVPPGDPVLVASPAEPVFDRIPIGAVDTLQITVGNEGGSPLVITSVALTGASIFALPDLVVPDTVGLAGSKVWNVTCSPNQPGSFSGLLTISSNDPAGPHIVSLSCEAFDPASLPHLLVSTDTLDFGLLAFGDSLDLAVRVTSDGTAGVAIRSVTVSDPETYTLVAAVVPDTLQPGAFVDLVVRCAPRTEQATGSLTIESDAEESPHEVTLSCAGSPEGEPMLVVSADTLSFGPVVVGERGDLPLLVRNEGTGLLEIQSAVPSDTTWFALLSAATGTTLMPGEERLWTVACTPRSQRVARAVLQVAGAFEGSSIEVALVCEGIAASDVAVSLSPSAVDFGLVDVGESGERSINYASIGEAPARIISSALQGSGWFSVVSGGEPGLVAPGTSRTLVIACAPDGGGVQTATIDIQSNAPGSPHRASLSCRGRTGLEAEITFTPDEADFGNVDVGSLATLQITLANSGAADLNILASSGDLHGWFSVAPALTGTKLGPGETRALTVTCRPDAAVERSDTLVVAFDAPTSPGRLPLRCRGQREATPEATVTPTLLDFGPVVEGAEEVASVRIQNSGSVSLAMLGARLEGSGAFSFATPSPTGTVIPGESASIDVRFAPSRTGPFAGTLVVETDAANSPHVVALSGVGMRKIGRLEVDVASLEFGEIRVGEVGFAGLTLRNTGTDVLSVTSVVVLGHSSLSLETSDPTGELAPGETRSIELACRPPFAGTFRGTLRVQSAPETGDVDVPLACAGVAEFFPEAQVSASALEFGAVELGGYEELSFTVSNIGTATLVVAAIQTTDPAFTIQAGGQGSVNPGASLETVVRFAPAAAGTASALCLISTNAADEPLQVTVTGEGVHAVPAAPALVSPPDGAIGVIAGESFEWAAVAAASRYRLEVGESAGFATPVISQEDLTAPFTTVSGLASGQRYYWRVWSLNPDGEGRASPEHSFTTYPAALSASTTVTFPAPLETGGYRMVALRGEVAVPVGDVFSGIPHENWVVYHDLGGEGTKAEYLRAYDGSDLFTFRPGRGFWAISERPMSFQGEAPTVPLLGDKTVRIPVHPGWNILANPYDIDVSWPAVQALNDIPDVLWAFDGGYAQTSRFMSGKAYYYYNRDGRETVAVAYAPPGAGKTMESAGDPSRRIDLVFSMTDSAEAAIDLGWDAAAVEGLDRHDWVAPPRAFSRFRLVSVRDGVALARDVRADTGPGYHYVITLEAEETLTGRFHLEGGTTLFEAAVLVDPADGIPHDLLQASGTPLAAPAGNRTLSLLVGSNAYVEERLAAFVPAETELLSPFPNPFSHTVALRLALPDERRAKLVVHDMLGRSVRRLADGVWRAGWHEFVFDGRDDGGAPLPAGVYLIRLDGDNLAPITRSVVLVR